MGLTKAQRSAISRFEAITGADASIAQRFLQATQWQLELACNLFLDGGSSDGYQPHARSQSVVDQTKIVKLFEGYSDASTGLMLAEGVEHFCEDLGVDPADIVMLVISYHFQAATSCEYTRSEFLAGMNRLSCDSIARLERRLPELRAQLQDPDFFQDVYNYAYLFSRERGQKCVQLDMALAMWRLVFAARPWPLLEAWCAFLERNHGRAVSRDTWVQLLDFAKTIKLDLSNFEDDAVSSAWPYLIDDFVAHLKEHPRIVQSVQSSALS